MNKLLELRRQKGGGGWLKLYWCVTLNIIKEAWIKIWHQWSKVSTATFYGWQVLKENQSNYINHSHVSQFYIYSTFNILFNQLTLQYGDTYNKNSSFLCILSIE